MAKESTFNGSICYSCEKCGFKFKEIKDAEECEASCGEGRCSNSLSKKRLR